MLADSGEVMIELLSYYVERQHTLSLEWPAPKGSHSTPVALAKFALDGTRRFLDDYYGWSV